MAQPLLVNGKPVNSPHRLFETGSRVYLIAVEEYRGEVYVDVRELWEPEPGQLARTKKAARIGINDIAEFMVELTSVVNESLGEEVFGLMDLSGNPTEPLDSE